MRFSPTIQKSFGANYQTWPDLALRVPYDGTLEVGRLKWVPRFAAPWPETLPEERSRRKRSHLHPEAVVVPVPLLRTMAGPVFGLGSLYTLVTVAS